MLNANQIALYFLNKDPELFTDEIIERNGIDMYEGNVRLNKYLHLAQNVHIAKTGELLFEEPLYAYENGGVVQSVYKNYKPLKKQAENPQEISVNEQHFLDQIFNSLKYATIDELIEMSHQDEEWIEKNKANPQKMNSIERVNKYREQYKDILTIMEMGLC